MTSTIAPNRNNSLTTTATTSTPDTGTSPADGSDGAVEEMSLGAPAATFTAAASTKRVAFSPPTSPVLVDEKKAADPVAARQANEEAVRNYNDQYGGYMDRYAEAVDNPAVTDAMLKRIGPPVAYDPGTGSLPVKQRAQYDKLQDPALATQRVAMEAFGDRLLEGKGVPTKTKLEGFFLEGQVTAAPLGAVVVGARAHMEETVDGIRKPDQFSAGAGLKSEHAAAIAWVNPLDPIKGEKSLELEGSAGGLFTSVEVSTKGKADIEGGIKLGDEHVGGKIGGHLGVDGNIAEIGGVVAGEFMGYEATGRAGVDLEVADPLRGTRADINGPGFFDNAKALRVLGGGR